MAVHKQAGVVEVKVEEVAMGIQDASHFCEGVHLCLVEHEQCEHVIQLNMEVKHKWPTHLSHGVVWVQQLEV